MPKRDVYENDDGSGGPLGFLKIIGHSRSLTSGFASFAIKTTVVATASSAIFGLTAYMVLSPIFGPVYPFLAGSIFGASGAAIHRVLCDRVEAQLMTARYPQIMAHHVALVEPSELRNTTFEEWVRDVPRNPRKQGVMITALYSAADTFARLDQEREERLVQALADKEVAAAMAAAE